MKKILTFILCTALLAALAVMPVSAFALTANKGTVNIDGVRDDIYSGPFEIKAFRSTEGASGKVWLAWDSNHIYQYIEVNDTTPNHEHADNYQRDCVEFFIDWNSAENLEREYDGNPYWQVRIASAPNEDGIEVSGRFNGEAIDINWPGVKYAVKPLVGSNLNGGYIIEAAFPHALAEGAVPLTDGMTVKIDYQVADNQDDNGRTSQAFLTEDDMDTQANSPAACHGVLTLLAAPEPPAVVDLPEALAALEETPAAEPAPAAVAPAATAPRTADPIAIISIAAIISAAGAVIARKRK